DHVFEEAQKTLELARVQEIFEAEIKGTCKEFDSLRDKLVEDAKLQKHYLLKFIDRFSMEVSERWVPGDEVELFHDLSWKMAIVLDDCSWNGYLVRLVGSLEELEVTKPELRVRQSYQNGEWVDADCAEQQKCYGVLPKENAARLDFYLKDICFDAQNNHNLKESGIFSSKTRKRASPCCYTQDEENEERPPKFRVSGKKGRRLIVLGTSTEMVDDVTNNRDMKENINGTNGSETGSFVSSSGSCSTNGCTEIYHLDTDQSHTDKAWADEIHRQELNAYRSTLDALYASGTLTWEKETMVTNLCLSLHISNDEHLVMLENLISASSSCHARTGHDSDAESTCQSGYHEDAEFYHGGAEIYHGDTDQSDIDEAWADEIHRQELNAYRSTLEALHASGP
nr:hypothetical protein [Tanacetum cinerariifolium]